MRQGSIQAAGTSDTACLRATDGAGRDGGGPEPGWRRSSAFQQPLEATEDHALAIEGHLGAGHALV
ncbi:MAG TPA: hypothetical protein VLK29_12540, partial [Luteimonas sp.]|nr:hypothetical protein [Luteimonas sp.]